MDPVSGVYLFYRRAFDFFGRSRRSEYLWALLLHLLMWGGVIFLVTSQQNLDVLLEADTESSWKSLNPAARAVFIIYGIYWVLSWLPWISLMVRRFHDMGYSGLMVLLFAGLLFVPVLGGLAGFALSLWLLFGGSSAGTNQYGHDPRFSAGREFA